MDIITDAQLLAKVEEFLEKHDMTPSAFGRGAITDPALVFQLRAGKRSLSLNTAKRVADFMAECEAAAAAKAA